LAYERILVGFDGRAERLGGLQLGALIARFTGAEMTGQRLSYTAAELGH
jgi:hypothetical protein